MPGTGRACDHEAVMPPLPARTRRLYRSADRRVLGGVSQGLALHLGVDVWLLRSAFLLYCLLDGSGAVAYGAFWLLVPLGAVPPGERSAPRPGARMALLAALAAGAVLVIGMHGAGAHNQWGVVLPALAVAAGLAALWRQADDEQRARWLTVGSRPRPADYVRGSVGALVVLGGIAVLINSGSSWSQASRTLLAGSALLGGAVLIALPFLLRVVRDLSAERAERIRSQERAEVAALMHDSVLHTLTLIQRQSTDAAEVVRLARAQERDLRQWLYADQPRPGGKAAPLSFAQAVKAAVAEVEDRYGVVVEVVAVGDTELDSRLRACVAAAREAVVNAAKYAGGASISVFTEVEASGTQAERVEVYVRDRGPGFDLAAVLPDRMGIRESVVGRMERHGGRATIKTAPGDGTEVRLESRRE